MKISPEQGGRERFIPGRKRRQEKQSQEKAARVEHAEREKHATQALKDGVETAVSEVGARPERFMGCSVDDREHKTRSGKVLYATRRITLTKELPNGDTLSLQKWGDPAPDGGIVERDIHYAAVLTQPPDAHPELDSTHQIGVVDTGESSRPDASRELAEALPDLVASAHFVEQE